MRQTHFAGSQTLVPFLPEPERRNTQRNVFKIALRRSHRQLQRLVFVPRKPHRKRLTALERIRVSGPDMLHRRSDTHEDSAAADSVASVAGGKLFYELLAHFRLALEKTGAAAAQLFAQFGRRLGSRRLLAGL